MKSQFWKPTTLSKRDCDTGFFPVNIAKCLRTAFFYRTPLMAAFGLLTKLTENDCEENHFSVEFFSEIS